jgi:hypothetical protein
MRQGNYEVLPGKEIIAKYGLTAESRPKIVLNPEHVPVAFRHLIHLAEEFGVSCDLTRALVLEKTPPEMLEALRESVLPLDEAFDEWLAGPEAEGPDFSPEYVAFTFLRIAADECDHR